MRIEDVSRAMEQQLSVEYNYMRSLLHYKISGCITRYDVKKKLWYYRLELKDKSGCLLITRLEDVKLIGADENANG